MSILSGIARFSVAVPALLLLCTLAGIADADVRAVAEAIRHESALPNNSKEGYPLPLAGHWNTGWFPGGFDPEYQLAMIEKGHYLLPAFHLPPPWESTPVLRSGYYEKSIKKAAALNLPISFISTQWERYLTVAPEYFMLPGKDNPNVVDNRGNVLKKVSPFGPVQLWQEVGSKWTSTPLMKKLQEWYPDPPLVIFVSNNEHPKLTWREAETSSRYMMTFGSGSDDNVKRKALGDGWIERYRAMQDGMRQNMTSAAWGSRMKFVAFDAIGTRAFGRWKDWLDYSLYIQGRMEPWPLSWDGVSVPYYLNNWGKSSDHTVMSPQIEAMNWLFMREEAWQMNPRFWIEMSTWDAFNSPSTDSKHKGKSQQSHRISIERYEGYVQFGMWLLRPRVVREFRNHLATVSQDEPHFMSVVRSVDRVHDNSVLKKFWRSGELVANREKIHPYQTNIPDEYKSIDRWFLLDTDHDPKRPWKLDTEIPVYAIALALGEKPNREWLIYAHSPLKRYGAVSVKLPGYISVTVKSTPDGNFFHVKEGKQVKLLRQL